MTEGSPARISVLHTAFDRGASWTAWSSCLTVCQSNLMSSVILAEEPLQGAVVLVCACYLDLSVFLSACLAIRQTYAHRAAELLMNKIHCELCLLPSLSDGPAGRFQTAHLHPDPVPMWLDRSCVLCVASDSLPLLSGCLTSKLWTPERPPKFVPLCQITGICRQTV